MNADDDDKAPGGGEDPRLSSLEARLAEAHRTETERTSPVEVPNVFTGKGVSQGNRVLSLLIGAPLGGLFIGFAIDQFFGTRPWAMLAMLFLGIVSAFVQVLRISKERAD